MKTIEQELAKQVYDRVETFAEAHPVKDCPERKKYGGLAHKLPILVRTAGLAEALAFAQSRKKDEHRDKMLDDLAQALGKTDRNALADASRRAGLQEYVRLTRRTMLALKWFKRFAQSVLEVEATDEGDERGGS
ncbi:MAG: type III-B CRISPR module-associated protein Cmr5 [Anaerolineae bacterium CG03_land_8_20_14_0_80_58_20]|nr:MAG: type III-B CRISPR module-associated protein Cmr5 [Anaerolineae bacterium CG03_land_8_20_14_0_80_58_20]